MKSITLEIDEAVDLQEFIQTITNIYNSGQIKTISSALHSEHNCYRLPDIVVNPIRVNNFSKFTREELHER
jgi:hypothetical protein